MAFITWDKELSVSINSIDEQHKKLVDMINDFYDNIQNRSNKENIMLLIKGMKEYAKVHFTFEERYMQQFNYSDYELHKKEHQLFIEKVDSLEEKYLEGKLILSFEITNFLKDWIKNHIQDVDKKYTECFMEHDIS
jgi:hemerythrin